MSDGPMAFREHFMLSVIHKPQRIFFFYVFLKTVVSTRSEQGISLLTFHVKDVIGNISVSLWGNKADQTSICKQDVVSVGQWERSSYNTKPTINTQTFSTITVSVAC